MGEPAQIGRAFRRSRAAAWTATALALGATALDLYLAPSGYTVKRAFPLVFAAASLLLLARRDLPTLGLTLRPVQGWAWWAKVGLVIGAIVGAACLVYFAGVHAGWFPRTTTALGAPPSTWASRFLSSCVAAPLLEELAYRVVLCAPLVATVRPSGAIVVSGAGFALLHFAYGCPSPDNLTAGFLFAFAYLWSGSVLLPLILHLGGNLFVLGAAVVGWLVTH